MEEIPAPLVTDSEDVTWALETALALWRRDERGDAVAWVRKAAQAAGDAADDDRAVWLARVAAELADQIAGKPKGDDELVIELEVEPSSRPSSADDVLTSAPPNVPRSKLASPPQAAPPPPPRKPPPPPPKRPPTAPPPRPASAAPPPRPASVAPPRPPRPAPPARPLPPPRPPIPTVDPEPMEETVTEWPPREASEPAMALPPVASSPSVEETVTEWPPKEQGVPEPRVPIEETVTEWPPRAGGVRPPSELPTRPHAGAAVGAGGFPTEAPTVARAPRASDLRPPSSAPSPAAAPSPPPPATSPSPAQGKPATVVPPSPPTMPTAEPAESTAPQDKGAKGTIPPPARGTIPPPGKGGRPREASAPLAIQIEGDILDEGEAPPTFRPPEPARRQPTVVQRVEPRPPPPSEGPRSSEPLTRRMPMPPQLLAATAQPAAGPPVDLAAVSELSDLPDDARDRFVARGTRQVLSTGERIERFALALVLRGEADLVAPGRHQVVERLRRGAVLRARGTAGPSQPVALVGALAGTELISWDEASVDEALGSCPWVESELRAAADRRLCHLGAMMGPLGARLDPDLREQLFEAVTVRALSPGETLTHEGETVPALAVVGVGTIELCKGGAVERSAEPGEILFGADVLRGARAPLQARAGAEGALVLLAEKARRAALFANFPSLLEILADM